MSGSSVLAQFLNGLAGASSLFLLAAGLSLIFGVTRIVNFAHGSLYMLGMYLAVWLADRVGFWPAVPLAALMVCFVGFLIEFFLLKKIFQWLPGDMLHPVQLSIQEYEQMLLDTGFQLEKSILFKNAGIFDYYILIAKKP